MSFQPTVETTLRKLAVPAKLFASDEVQVLADALAAAEARLAALTEALTGALAELDAYVGIANPVGLVGRWMPIDGAQRIFARARAVLVEGAREKAYTGGTRS